MLLVDEWFSCGVDGCCFPSLVEISCNVFYGKGMNVWFH